FLALIKIKIESKEALDANEGDHGDRARALELRCPNSMWLKALPIPLLFRFDPQPFLFGKLVRCRFNRLLHLIWREVERTGQGVEQELIAEVAMAQSFQPSRSLPTVRVAETPNKLSARDAKFTLPIRDQDGDGKLLGHPKRSGQELIHNKR